MSLHYHILVYPAGKGGEAQTLLVTEDGAEALRVLEAFHWCAPEAHAGLHSLRRRSHDGDRIAASPMLIQEFSGG